MVKKKAKKVEEKQETVSSKSKMKVNYWMVATAVLALLLLINGLVAMTSGISAKEAEKEMIDSMKAMYGIDIHIEEISKKGEVYEGTFIFDGESHKIHITRDGKYTGMFVEVEELKTLMTGQAVASTTQTQQPQSQYSEAELVELNAFNDCLGENGLKIYGASWCGICAQLSQLMGGYDVMEEVYVECTEQENVALCSEKVDRGYPTIRLNGELYQGARTLEAFSQATGCPVPNLS